jgi:hypothetical protein
MNTAYHLDGMVIRDQDNNYVCEIVAYEKDGLNNLLRTPEPAALDAEDLVPVPRGLLGSARYAILHKCDAPNTYAKLGEYVYPNGNTADVDVLVAADESVRAMLADRNIKAANLKTLVDMVLAHEAASEALVENTNAALEDTLSDAAQAAGTAMIDLARGLKQ